MCQNRLFSAYRLDQYTDPKGFMLQVAAVFSQYEDAVLLRATDPLRRDCMQRTHKWPPSLKEICVALDATVEALAGASFATEAESRGFFWKGNGFFNAEGDLYSRRKHGHIPQMRVVR